MQVPSGGEKRKDSVAIGDDTEIMKGLAWRALAIILFTFKQICGWLGRLTGVWDLQQVLGVNENKTLEPKTLRAPTFYAAFYLTASLDDNEDEDDWWFHFKLLIPIISVSLVVAIIFGAIHFIAWLSHFPSHTKQYLWCLYSIVLVGAPLLVWLLLVLLNLLNKLLNMPLSTFFMIVFADSVLLLLMCTGTLYTVGRFTLLVELFISLRSLPAAAYETVNWTTSIPHI